MKTEKAPDSPFTAFGKLLASVKLTIVLLMLLTTTSVIGTLIPQNANPAAYMKAYGEFAFRALQFFDLLDMYHSWWFRTLIGLLAVNIIVCTLRRWLGTWKIVTSSKLKSGSTDDKHPLHEFTDPRKPEELMRKYLEFIRSRYRFLRIEPGEQGFRILAEKGRWTWLGVPVVHLSIVLILAGALVGSLLGFEGFVNIREGGTTDRVQLRNSRSVLPLGFQVRCDDFNVSYYDSGAPKEYRSSLTILEKGRVALRKDIIVNDPLRYKGINFFQSSYGTMPPENLKLSLTRKESGETFRLKVSMAEAVDLPQNAGRFTLREFRQDYHYKESELGEALIGILEKPGKEPEEVVLPLRFPSFDKMRRDEWTIAVGEYTNRYYTGLQVTRDPGVPLVYAGFILMLMGCCVRFFMSHKKIMVDVKPVRNRSLIRIFGSVNRNRIGFDQQMGKLAEALRRL